MNKEHLDVLKSGVENWNNWREENPEIIPDLSYANLSNTHLRRANLRRANLRSANLIDANLIDANLINANLINTDLSYANLINANLYNSNVSYTNLRLSNLINSDLRSVNLIDAKYNSKIIPQIATDPRGYRLAIIGEYVTAGCHTFESVEDAIAHWSSPDYPDKKRGQDYVDNINYLLSKMNDK